jgi:hypothetical protein
MLFEDTLGVFLTINKNVHSGKTHFLYIHIKTANTPNPSFLIFSTFIVRLDLCSALISSSFNEISEVHVTKL